MRGRQSDCVWLLLVLLIYSSCDTSEPVNKTVDWPVYQGDPGRNQYSILDQINKENVDQLKVAWEFNTGDADTALSQIQCNPLILDGVLYGTSPKLKLFALDAATGEQLWEFDPRKELNPGLNANRGVTYFNDGRQPRIFYTAGPHLFSINAETGEPIPDFGENGVASLKAGLEEDFERDVSELFVASSTPGVIFEDKLIIGTRVSEAADAAPGHIRAYNVYTGEIEWIFHTIPRPGEFGYDTWPAEAYLTVGGANSWSGMSLDERRGVVYVPTGSASFDFWGGNRIGKNLFANSIIALDAGTGERIWHYQTVHHDVLDRDLPAPPNLVTVKHDGEEKDAVAQITKSGYVFLLDRDTGEPLFPVEEKPFPPSDLNGELTWPTQPVPTLPPPFARQAFTEDLITNINDSSHQYVRSIWEGKRTGSPFVPPSKEGTIIFPGFDGGGEWGGAAVDEKAGILYVNSNEMAWILTMVEKEMEGRSIGELVYLQNCALCHGPDRQGDQTGTYPELVNVKDRLTRDSTEKVVATGRGFMPSFKQLSEEEKDALIDYLYGVSEQAASSMEGDFEFEIPYTTTGYNRFFDQNGYPAVKPPWGTLNAIDLNEGKILWQVPLGEFRELTEQGIPKTGTENYGGPVVTAGGLIFIGASQDEYFHAFDNDTGEELWNYKLPAGGYATPSTYMVNGKQYVVIACGGGKMGTKSGDSYIAFELR